METNNLHSVSPLMLPETSLSLHIFQMVSVTETETLAAYMKPPSRYGGAGRDGGLDDGSGGPAKGFVVRDAPWNAAGNKVTPVHSLL